MEHMKNEHPEEINNDKPEDIELAESSFEFRVTGKFRDPLTRRLTEMVRIRLALYKGKIGGEKGGKGTLYIGKCLNSKEKSFAPIEKKWRKRTWNN